MLRQILFLSSLIMASTALGCLVVPFLPDHVLNERGLAFKHAIRGDAK